MRKARTQLGVAMSLWPEHERRPFEARFKKVKSRREAPRLGDVWAPATFRTVGSAYSCGLGWLSDNGLLDWSVAPIDRWSEPVLELYCAHLESYSHATAYSRLSGLERAIALIDPTADRSLLRSAMTRTGKPTGGSNAIAQSSDDLIQLGIDLMDGAATRFPRDPRRRSAQYRTGLQIAFLGYRFWRLGEFHALRAWIDVRFEDQRWVITSPLENTPSKKRAERLYVPARLNSYVYTYLHEHRVCLCAKRYTGEAMWVSMEFNAQSQNSIRENIRDKTKKRFEIALSPHGFRHSAITTVAIHNPSAMDAAATVAGHSPTVRDRHYNLADSFSASRTVNELRATILHDARQRRRLVRRRQ